MGVGVTTPQRTVHVMVRGRVQGVGFRWFAARAASAQALIGWVRNTADGSVEVAATGPTPAIDAFLAALQRGPAHARVDAVEVEDGAATLTDGYTDFEIEP